MIASSKSSAKGGMGQVFLAEDTELHCKTAMTFLPEKFTADPAFKTNFKRDARVESSQNG